MLYKNVVSFFAYICWPYSYFCQTLNQFKASHKLRNNAWTIIGWILLPNLLNWISYAAVHKQLQLNYMRSWEDILFVPDWGLPAWTLPWVSIVLDSMMGYAAFMVYTDCDGLTMSAVLPLALYGGHLILNITWMPILIRYYFIKLVMYHLMGLTVTSVACAACFYYINRKTLYLMAPQVVYSAYMSIYMYCIYEINPTNVF